MPKGFRSTRLTDLNAELAGVERWLLDLRNNRGRWPRKWCSGMIRYYDNRRMLLRDRISREKRKSEKH